MSKYEDIRYTKTNRQNVRTGRGGAFWCYHCDCQLNRECIKCINCGAKDARYRLRNKRDQNEKY